MSLLGLVRHMADGEHQWFTLVLGGEQEEQAPYPYYTDDNQDADFDDADVADVAEAFETWRGRRGRSMSTTGRETGRTQSSANAASDARPTPRRGADATTEACSPGMDGGPSGVLRAVRGRLRPKGASSA